MKLGEMREMKEFSFISLISRFLRRHRVIELAPRHKIGLNLAQPVMIAAGCGGYGNAYPGLIDLAAFGAVVTQPISLRPRRGRPQPRLAETRAGFILETGQQNPGVKKVIQAYRKSWFRLGIPIIAHLPADEPEALTRTARALAGVQSPQGHAALAGFELGLAYGCTAGDVTSWLEAVREGTEFPILVKIPIGVERDIAEAAVEAQADALVIGLPPLGTAFLPDAGQMVTGPLYGPALHSLALHSLQRLAGLAAPLIASGGIHSVADAQAFFEAGATAVQIDSLLFIDPKAAEEVALAFKE
jgi:dihydroorotate dehydrogenase (NAD+) catalytic subunit